MAQWRVGSEGLRVTTKRGTYSLPPGTVLDELPNKYEGTLTVIEWGDLRDRPAMRKRIGAYADKKITPAEDKSGG